MITDSRKEKKPIHAKPATPTSTAVAAPVPAVIMKMDANRLGVSLSNPKAAQMASVIAGVSTCIYMLGNEITDMFGSDSSVSGVLSQTAGSNQHGRSSRVMERHLLLKHFPQLMQRMCIAVGWVLHMPLHLPIQKGALTLRICMKATERDM